MTDNVSLLMITISVLGCIALSFALGYIYGFGKGHENSLDYDVKHSRDPLIPPGATLPYGVTRGR